MLKNLAKLQEFKEMLATKNWRLEEPPNCESPKEFSKDCKVAVVLVYVRFYGDELES